MRLHGAIAQKTHHTCRCESHKSQIQETIHSEISFLFMICVHKNFHTPSYNGSFSIPDRKLNTAFGRQPCCFNFIKILGNKSYKFLDSTSFRDHSLSRYNVISQLKQKSSLHHYNYINVVQGNNRCLMGKSSENHKYTLWAKCRTVD
jgi:hypothetical protein